MAEKASSTNGIRKIWVFSYKRMKLDPCLSPYMKSNLKLIKGLNEKPENRKLIEDRVGSNLSYYKHE